MYEFTEQIIDFLEPERIWNRYFQICLSNWVKPKRMSIRRSADSRSRELAKINTCQMPWEESDE